MNKPTVIQVPAHSSNYSTNVYKKTGIVLHWMVGTLAGTGAHFKNPNTKASTQYGIGKDGTIHQFVADNHTAYHASTAHNRSHFSIEHEGGYLVNGARVKPSPECHAASAGLVAWLCKTYGIPCDRDHIIGHNETGYATECPGTLDINLIISEANKLLNNPPMSFNFDLYVKDNNLYMRVTSGSIKETITVKNITKGTSWTTHAEKSVGKDGNYINKGMEPCLYEVIAKGVTKQFDNRPDPCANVKAELATANKVIQTKDGEIAKLNSSIGGLTTDRNKYKDQVDALKVELADTKTENEDLRATNQAHQSLVNQLNHDIERIGKEKTEVEKRLSILLEEKRQEPEKIERLTKELWETKSHITTLEFQKADLERKLKIAQSNKQGVSMTEFINKVVELLKRINFKKTR